MIEAGMQALSPHQALSGEGMSLPIEDEELGEHASEHRNRQDEVLDDRR